MKTKPIQSIMIISLLLLVLGLTYVNLVCMKDIPKRYCHTETKTEKIELSAKYNVYGFYIWGSPCEEYEGKILCEESVELYPLLKKVCNWGDGIKVCLVEKTEKICEIK